MAFSFYCHMPFRTVSPGMTTYTVNQALHINHPSKKVSTCLPIGQSDGAIVSVENAPPRIILAFYQVAILKTFHQTFGHLNMCRKMFLPNGMSELFKLTELPGSVRETTNLLPLKHFTLLFQRMVASSIYSSSFSLYILPIFLTSRGVGFQTLFSTIDLHSLQAISLDGVQWLPDTAEDSPRNKSFTSLAHPTLFCPYLPWLTNSILRLSFFNPLVLVSGLSEALHYFSVVYNKIVEVIFDYLSCIHFSF